MYTFVSEYEDQAIEGVETLIKSVIRMENTGSLSDEDTDECLYYLQKITEITGVEVDFYSLCEDEEETATP